MHNNYCLQGITVLISLFLHQNPERWGGGSGQGLYPTQQGRQTSGRWSACLHSLLRLWRREGKGPRLSCCLPQSPSSLFPCLPKHQPAGKCEGYQSTDHRSVISLIFSSRLTLVFTLIILKSELWRIADDGLSVSLWYIDYNQKQIQERENSVTQP